LPTATSDLTQLSWLSGRWACDGNSVDCKEFGP
jgi:hypothetical protein